MLNLDGYGSDSGSDEESVAKPPKPVAVPKAKKKIAIALPSIKPTAGPESDDIEDQRPPKRARLETGAGASSLLSMLPAPKQKSTVLPKSERVLGGGTGASLDFRNSGESSSSAQFVPTSVAKGKPNISSEEVTSFQTSSSAPSVDFFSLTPSSSKAMLDVGKRDIRTVSSAPAVPVFEPPEPTPNDPYPGYYLLPSGQWAAHDPEYFAKFAKKWQAEYDAHVRALEKGTAKGFEGVEDSAVEEIDAMKEMERAKVEIQEREERKAMTRGAEGTSAPKMKITASKMSGIARSRHQLATMLNEAYTNREALEDKIAEGRRNRKEAGNKYGF